MHRGGSLERRDGRRDPWRCTATVLRNVEHLSPSVTASLHRRAETTYGVLVRCTDVFGLGEPHWDQQLRGKSEIRRGEVLGASATKQNKKKTASPVMFVRLSAWNNWASAGRTCMKFCVCVSRVWLENQISFKIWQEYRILYVKTPARLSPHLAELFLEFKMFQTEVVEKIKAHILCLTSFFPKIVPFMR